MSGDELLEKIKIINNSFKSKEYLPFYFLYGVEDYFLLNIKHFLLKSFEDETKLNTKIYDKSNFNFNETLKYIGNIPLMNEKKLIVFDNIDFFRCSKNDSEIKSSELAQLIESFDKNKDINIILITNTEFDNDYSKFYKSNPIVDYINNNGIVLDLERLDNASLTKMIQTRFKKYNVNIDKLCLAYLINLCGNDLTNLYNEIDKLVAFVSDKKIVKKEDINEIVTRSLDDRVYNLVELYNNKRMEDAIKFYGDLLSEGEHSKEEIFRTFANNYSYLIVCKDLMLKNKSMKEISEIMGVPSWRVKKLMDANKYTNIESLKIKLKEITELSVSKIKGNINDDYMLILLMNKV